MLLTCVHKLVVVAGWYVSSGMGGGGGGVTAAVLNKAVAQGMLAIISVMRLGESPALPTPLDGEWLA